MAHLIRLAYLYNEWNESSFQEALNSENELELLERNVPRSRAQSSRIKDPAKAAGTAVPPVLSLRSI